MVHVATQLEQAPTPEVPQEVIKEGHLAERDPTKAIRTARTHRVRKLIQVNWTFRRINQMESLGLINQ